MESSSKRRKLAHADPNIKQNGLIDFGSRKTTQVSTASTFVLQTDELLNKTKLDYVKTLGDVDSHLHRLKTAIESIAPHEAIPVGSTHALDAGAQKANDSRFPKLPRSLRRSMAFASLTQTRNLLLTHHTRSHSPSPLNAMLSEATCLGQ